LRHAVALVSIKSGAGLRAFCSSSVGISQQSGVEVQLVTPMRVKRSAKGEKLVGGHVFSIICVGQGKSSACYFLSRKNRGFCCVADKESRGVKSLQGNNDYHRVDFLVRD
ncbi:unnamed protein product, partial [Scytosiphon promiscuus]